uniref:B30.2/SPRY domain-containing protein n=1 Tax=Favella ehrenbergii TaxID=182087 RepID=A0A7S3I2R6_9SPIT|mmetsp:Transcript_27620/g.34290  ORF Transcript_27620/g.34290 Transcript_27620/m.34290 type:complete len:161 (+) Transcript_27620:668-1150(+)
MCAEIELTQSGKVCRATNQEHCFKTAFGTEVLLPSHRYYFEFKCVRGTNFKFGIATEQARANPNMAFCDDKHGYAYFSTGALRHASKGMGPSYGEKFKQDDIIGVYVDLADGVVFYAKNGAVVAKNAFEGAALQGRKFYPAACCLTKNEMFELLEPAVED